MIGADHGTEFTSNAMASAMSFLFRLTYGFTARLPVDCLETRQVKAALSAKRYQSGEVDRVMGPIKGSAHKKILTPAGPAL